MMDVTSTTARKRKKKQSTLFVGPGAVKQRIVDKKNRAHYVPLDDESIAAMTKDNNSYIVDNQCMNCGKTFKTVQGLGNHRNQ